MKDFKLELNWIDLYSFPQKKIDVTSLNNYNTLTVGDMHGNALKLIHILTIYQFWDLKKDDYKKLMKIYHGSFLSKTDFKSFKNIVKGQRPNLYHPIEKLRFLGDMFADRGRNDYLTLIVLEWLNKNRFIDYEIIWSNHGYEFLRAYLNDFKEHKTSCLASSKMSSLATMRCYLELCTLEKAEVRGLAEKCFINHLKLLAVEVFPQQKNGKRKEIVFYTHAPATYEMINFIMKSGSKERMTYDNINKIVDGANEYFKEKAVSIYKNYQYPKGIITVLQKIGPVLDNYTFSNNNNSEPDRWLKFVLPYGISPELLRNCNLWSYYLDCHFQFVFGHIGNGPGPNGGLCSSYNNLDSYLGVKDPGYGRYQGYLKAWYSSNKTPAEKPPPKEPTVPKKPRHN